MPRKKITTAPDQPSPRRRRRLSKAARARIADAQRARWAALRATRQAGSPAARPTAGTGPRIELTAYVRDGAGGLEIRRSTFAHAADALPTIAALLYGGDVFEEVRLVCG